MPIITVAGVLMRGEAVLLGKRLPSLPFSAGVWHPVTGLFETDDQAIEDALMREMRALLGIAVREFEFIETMYEDSTSSQEHYIHNIYFVYEWDGEPQNLAPHVHEELGWFSAEELAALPMSDEVRQSILAVLEGLWL